MKVIKFFLANGDFYNGWAICRGGIVLWRILVGVVEKCSLVNRGRNNNEKLCIKARGEKLGNRGDRRIDNFIR